MTLQVADDIILQFLCGQFSGPEGMNDTCEKMMHIGTMDRGFPVGVAGVISFSECLVCHIYGSGHSFAVLEAREVNGKHSYTAQSQTICKVHNSVLHCKIVKANVICLNHEFRTM